MDFVVANKEVDFVVAYIEGEEDKWKFLCKKGDTKNSYRIVYNYNGEEFVGLKMNNILYKIRDATKEDIDEAILRSI